MKRICATETVKFLLIWSGGLKFLTGIIFIIYKRTDSTKSNKNLTVVGVIHFQKNQENLIRHSFVLTLPLKKSLKYLFLYESIFVMAIDSYRNKISEWAMGFRYGNFTLKLARGKKSLASRGPTALGRQAFLPVG